MNREVLLFQIDGKLPNLALMRIARHHRKLGDTVLFRQARGQADLERGLFEEPDLVYASAIFTRSRSMVERVQKVYPEAIVGGTGWKLESRLEDVGIHEQVPDYSLYPLFTASMGFTQRGCRQRCPFCVVPHKEGRIVEDQTIAEIWRGEPWPRDVILLDNDFFGQPRWRDRIAELQAGGFRVNFTQGFNVRLVTDEQARAIASVHYRDTTFLSKRIYVAWDNRKDEARVFHGLELLAKHGVRPWHVLVYMLIGYWPGETHEDRDYRRRKIREFGALPFPMPYTKDPELLGFQRWCLRGVDKRISWEDFTACGWQLRDLPTIHEDPQLDLEVE